jgi:ATP-dependent helicase HrpA
VAIHLFDTREVAQASMRGGVRQLLRFELKEQLKQLERNLPGLNQAALQLQTLINPAMLKQDMLNAIVDRAFIAGDALPRGEKDFIAQRQRARVRLPAVIEAVARIVQNVANECQPLLMKLSMTGGSSTKLKGELAGQLGKLVYPGFLDATPWDRLQHLPRYLKGMVLRLDKYSANSERDSRHGGVIAGLCNQYEQRLERHRKAGISDPALTEFRWQIEELRISLFAQELKTPTPVSTKRLQKLWEGIRA